MKDIQTKKQFEDYIPISPETEKLSREDFLFPTMKDMKQKDDEQGYLTGGAANIVNNNQEYLNKLKEMAKTESDKKFLDYMGHILNIEKGYVNHPADVPTNLGVTQPIYNVYRKNNNLPIQSVKNITIQEAITIYYKYFWKPSGADKLEHPLDLVYFDMYVNSPPKETKQILNRSNGDVHKFIENRKKYYKKVADVNQKKKAFTDGWSSRLNKLEKYVDDYYKKKEN